MYAIVYKPLHTHPYNAVVVMAEIRGDGVVAEHAADDGRR